MWHYHAHTSTTCKYSFNINVDVCVSWRLHPSSSSSSSWWLQTIYRARTEFNFADPYGSSPSHRLYSKIVTQSRLKWKVYATFYFLYIFSPKENQFPSHWIYVLHTDNFIFFPIQFIFFLSCFFFSAYQSLLPMFELINLLL